MNVRDIMTSPVVTTTANSTVEQAAQLMLERSTSCLPVLDDQGQMVGILTHTDFGFHHKFLPMADHLYTLMGSWVRPDTLRGRAGGEQQKGKVGHDPSRSYRPGRRPR